MRRTTTTVVMAAIALTTSTARAQDAPRGYLSLNGGYQFNSTTFRDTRTTTVNQEDGSETADYSVRPGPAFDFGGAFRVLGRLGVGVAVTSFSRTESAGVAAHIPHPFFFNKFRDVSGIVGSISRKESAVHVQLSALVPPGKKVTLAIFGGPSFFSVNQTVVRAVHYTESYPYDTATFSGADTSSESNSKLGFNAGFDLGWYFAKTIGAGAVVRYDRASVTLSNAGGHALAIQVGGLKAGGGLRVRF